MVWTEDFNCHSARIARNAIRLSVAWGNGGFSVNVNGRSLTKKYTDLDEGKQAAVALAKKIIAEAATELENA